MVKKVIAGVLSIICLLPLLCHLSASAVEVNLPDSFCVDDENGVSVSDSGDYFLYMEDIQPGDRITRSLTLRNLEQGDPFMLYLLNEPGGTTGLVDWLDNLHMVITLDGREIYAGRLRGDGKDTRTMKGNGADLNYEGLFLKEFHKGDYAVLKFEVTADSGHLAAEDVLESSEAKTRFLFNAVKNVEKEDGPKTGEIIKNGLYLLLLLLLILCGVFYYRYRRLREIAN